MEGHDEKAAHVAANVASHNACPGVWSARREGGSHVSE